MYFHERESLNRIAAKLKQRLAARVVAIYAFGSRVRGDHDLRSDFDVLVVVRDKEPGLESEIVGIFVDEEMASGASFTPVIKDARTFEYEKKYHTPFYENLARQGVLL